MNKLSLKPFTDYRSFLLAHYERTKQVRRTWTFGAYAKAVGLSSTSTLTKILQGDRHPGPEITEKLIEFFRFDRKDAERFRDLIAIHKAKPGSVQARTIVERMGKEKHQALLKTIDLRTFSVISKWHCFVIREMTKLADFRETPTWIASRLRFHLSERDILKAIAALRKTNMIQPDPKKGFVCAEERFQTTGDIPNEAIKLYHESVLDLAKASIRKVPVEEREFLSTTLTIAKSRVPEAKRLIDEFHEKFVHLLETEEGDETYQFQIQLFPVTQPVKTSHSQEISHEA